MGVQALSHEVAFRTSRRVVRIFAPVLREEEQAEAVNEVYGLVVEAIREFADRLNRERDRLGKAALPTEVSDPSSSGSSAE